MGSSSRPADVDAVNVETMAASQDVSLLVLAGSAHCDNFAATPHVLWDRLGTWAAAAADHMSGGAALAA